MEELLEAKDAAVLLKVAPITLYKWRRAGKGPECAKIGRKVLYFQSDIEKFIQSKKEKTSC